MILEDIFLIQIIVTIIFCIVFSVYDIRRGYIPNKLNYILLAFGFLSNLALTILSGNVKFILFSIVSYSITYAVNLMLWELNVWGGGDVKIFTSIAAVIPFGIDIPLFNISPLLSVYPFSFTVMVNSILVLFPFLVCLLFYLAIKNEYLDENIEIFKGFLNYRSLKLLIESNFNKHITIQDLKEGMMINNYYFDSEQVKELIENSRDSNLKVFKSNDGRSRYYFKTVTAGGITMKDMYLLKIMNAQNIISNQISVKLGLPFVPAILIALIIAVFYGDLCMLILKNIIFVI